MKELNKLLKHPNVRFKTIAEMVRDFGENWMDLIINLSPEDAMNVMSHYAGKVFYPEMVSFAWSHTFRYGPTQILVDKTMLTTHALPKYDSQGNILKPGHIVRVEYTVVNPTLGYLIPANLRNEPGILVKVLKVVRPADYLNEDIEFDKDNINKLCVAVELRNPYSGAFIDMIHKSHAHYFRDKQLRAFEISYRVTKATDEEKEFYNLRTV